MADKKDYVIGFDLGGTKMLSAVVDSDGKILGTHKQKTLGHESQDEIYERFVETVEASVNDAKISMDEVVGIGVGSPGPLDKETGKILDTPNIALKNFPLGEKLRKTFGLPVIVDNDVNVGTWGEYVYGAGKGVQHMIGVFPGTGIGGGLILNGKLFGGATGAAGEIGHMIMQQDGPLCGCGQRGCMESLASKTAIGREAATMAANGKAPSVLEKAGTDYKQITSKVIYKAVKNNESAICELVERSAFYVGLGMANLVNILSPELIVIGGGLIEKLGKTYLDKAESTMRKHAMPFLVEKVKVKEAALGDDAVILGAANLIREKLTNS